MKQAVPEMRAKEYVKQKLADGREETRVRVKIFASGEEDAPDDADRALSNKFGRVSVATMTFDQLTAKIAEMQQQGGQKASIQSLTEAHHNIAARMGPDYVQTRIMRLQMQNVPKEDPQMILLRDTLDRTIKKAGQPDPAKMRHGAGAPGREQRT